MGGGPIPGNLSKNNILSQMQYQSSTSISTSQKPSSQLMTNYYHQLKKGKQGSRAPSHSKDTQQDIENVKSLISNYDKMQQQL